MHLINCQADTNNEHSAPQNIDYEGLEMKTYSDKEEELFLALKASELLNYEPALAYRTLALICFAENHQGLAADSLRRCYNALQAQSPTRFTPAFDELIDLLNAEEKPFILVFRPHQTPAFALSFENEAEFIEHWKNGSFDRKLHTNNNLSEEQSEPNYINALTDVGHDLYSITRLDSVEQVKHYIHDNPPSYDRHNRGTHAVKVCATKFGWLEKE